ncbi:Alpha/Beta hydrolase protein [Aspergillus lucknowensis]|uniref:Carboxylic ester hydrolase n=1 Tax=Aspergillus lucknowensis TaxID=176173 RepID=A0ABR4M182_9EURO
MFACGVVSLFLSLAALGAAAPELHVLTSSGPVHGIYNDSASTVRAFLGIPYAEAPTGDLRFAPPREKSPSHSPIDASKYGPPCPQLYNPSNQSIWDVLPYGPWNTADMTEDCLSINVWTPSKGRLGDNKAAVLLFVHGGGYTSGAGSNEVYDGVELVRDNEDAILVTFNYRLNFFGFPNSPGLKLSEQNVGFLDQRLAVEWVHRNIANFGGDPERILLFGQSAGAGSVDAYAYAYPDEPLVSAFGLESGTASRGSDADPTESDWNALSAAVGCGTGPESLSCMREVPFKIILDEMDAGNYNFAPIPDNRTFFSDPAARARDGGLAKLPTMGGIAEREFSAAIPLNSTSVNETEIIEGVYDFSCGLHEALGIRLEQDIPTWRYVYHGNFTNLSPTPWLGAYHSSDLPMVFGTYNMSDLPPGPTPNEMATSKYIQGAYVAFAKDPVNGLYDYGWPMYTMDDGKIVNLGVDNEPGAVLSPAADWDVHCT